MLHQKGYHKRLRTPLEICTGPPQMHDITNNQSQEPGLDLSYFLESKSGIRSKPVCPYVRHSVNLYMRPPDPDLDWGADPDPKPDP